LDNKIPEALPAAVRAWLSQASQALIDSLGEELKALILFGSAAEGPMHASSDVNLTAIIERDGHYPDFSALLEQIARARAALLIGRAHRRKITARQVA
jgi:predicted nucleotidyltransferase